MLDWIKTIINYNYWAHHKLIQCIMTVTDADFEKDVPYSIGSLKKQVVHTMWAEDIWYTRIRGFARPDYMPADFASRDAIWSKWKTLETQWRDYIGTLDEGTLAQEYTMTRANGEELVHTIQESIVHMVNHGTDHRSQMLRIIHDFGGETFEQDMAYYFRELRG